MAKGNIRIERLQEIVKRDIAGMLATEMRDPRLRFGSVLKVELTGDLRHAKVYVSCLGSEADRRTFMRGLRSARYPLQARVASHLRTRATPRLSFVYDEGLERSIELGKTLQRALSEDREAQIARGEIVDDEAITEADEVESGEVESGEVESDEVESGGVVGGEEE
jgi:ribosome-binding factor A